MDGLDSSEILLIDQRGCPTDFSIMGVLSEVNGSGRTLQANFDAFKFPTSDLVQFRALVTPCIPRCDPVRCDVTDYYGREQRVQSFGKRRKRSSDDEEDFMVAGAIRISDKFDLEEEQKTDVNSNDIENTSNDVTWSHKEEEHSDSCGNTFALAFGALIFLLAQCALIGVWTFLYFKRKKERQSEKQLDYFHDPNEEEIADYDPYFSPEYKEPEMGSSNNSNRKRKRRKCCHCDKRNRVVQVAFGDIQSEPRSV